MASYKVILKPSVEKDLRSLPPSVVRRVFERVEALQNDPFPRRSLKLAGAQMFWYQKSCGCGRQLEAWDLPTYQGPNG